MNARVGGINGFAESTAMPVLRRTIPFDYAFRYELHGERNLVQNSTVSVSIEAAFTAVSIGYGVVPTVQPIEFGIPPPIPAGGGIALAAIPPRFLPASLDEVIVALAKTLDEDVKLPGGRIGPRTAAVLRDGIRLNPEFAEKILLATAGGSLSGEILGRAFRAVAAPPERIAFKYALFDDGSGREFQSEPILNLAGLGASDGGRPFRYFARPIEFAPRSAIRMQITELSEFQGELHVSLQGYKTLGGFGTPTGARPTTSPRHRR
jgi:hypothetical protein